ncbi:hypothetical protein V1283_005180 [Bradyrhizobium sp. AZCC 2262]
MGNSASSGHYHAVHHDLAGDRGAQGQLAADLRRRQALHALLENEAADLVVMRGGLRPHHEDVGDRGVGNPHLAAGQLVAVGDLLGAGLHAVGVGAGIRLGQTEAADPLAGGELGQVFLALGFVAIGVDRIHHQRRLHRVHRAIAAIDALDLARHEAIGNVARVGAAILLRQRDTDQTEFAHLVEDLAVGLLFEIGLDDARQQLVLRVGARGVADHAFVFGELLVEQERIVPLERSRRRLVLGLRAHAHENPFRITVLMEIVDKIMRYRQKRKWIG